jgi:hypothetical protein
MFFKKGLKDSVLIRKLIMKNPRSSEEMLAITNKYALAKEATLDNKAESVRSARHIQRQRQEKEA